MRLGELLVAAGWIDPALVDAALARQRRGGPRLGAILVGAGLISADDIARGLARQRGVPAALERHLAQRDPALAAVLPAAVAVPMAALPIAWSRGAQGMSLVVCFRDPTPEHVAEVARAVGVPVIPAVACEVVVARALAQTYPEVEAPAAGALDIEAATDDADAVDVDFDEPSAPVFTLVSDVIVTAAPPQRAGAASAISETCSEFSAASGIALLGSLGIWLYRARMQPVLDATLPAALHGDALATLGGTLAAAHAMGGAAGAALDAAARAAFAETFRTVARVATGVVVAAALIAARLLRSPPQAAPAPAPAPAPSAGP